MKKVLLCLTIITLIVSGCNNPTAELQSLLSRADFPAIVVKVEAHDTARSKETTGCYTITLKKANGTTVEFTTNESFTIGDTLSMGLDHSGAFAAVMNMVALPNTKSDSTSAAPKDTVVTEIQDTTNSF
jgi:uncharacterized lipoprotein NlpE involved in copper resistance